MHFKVFVCFLAGFALNNFVSCDSHSAGSLKGGDKVVYGQQIFSKFNVKPTNYTVIFKYIAPEFSPEITLVNFYTTSRSNGTVEIKSDPKKDKTVLATINVIDGTNVTVMAQIHTTSVTTGVNFAVLNTMHKPKVFTVAYAHNTTQTRNRKINLGQRQQGDVVLAEQTKNVTLSTRFAEAEFIYKSPNTHITAVSFSFSSPTAVAFVNTTFIKEDSLDVIVYDLNSPGFIANMSVYGYHYPKPLGYKSIVLTKPIVGNRN